MDLSQPLEGIFRLHSHNNSIYFGHNTIRGAAGTAVLIAELAVANNLL